MATTSIAETINAINRACNDKGGVYSEYSCKTVSWDDVSRGTVGGGLSCWGSNITDTYLKSKDDRQLYTVRSDNWNEKLGVVDSKDVKLVTGNQFQGASHDDLDNISLKEFLAGIEQFGGYAGIEVDSLENKDLDKKCSIRFQTTFLPVEEENENSENGNENSAPGNIEFSTEAYNYNTTDDSDPRNLVLLASSQGIALQQDGTGAKKIFHHAIDESSGELTRYWLEAERSKHKVGGEQKESKEEKEDAVKRGKAVSNLIGIEAMGSRFNVLLTVQIPLQQKKEKREEIYDEICYSSCYSSVMQMCSATEPIIHVQYKTSACDYMTMSNETKCLDYDDYDESCASLQLEETSEIQLSSNCSHKEVVESMQCTSLRRTSPIPEKLTPKEGVANAARVSRGSKMDTWSGLSIEEPVRNEHEHLTISVVIYFTVVGGVPSQKDVIAAIDDMEMLYDACKVKGNLVEEKFDFMKKELTVNDMLEIWLKKSLIL